MNLRVVSHAQADLAPLLLDLRRRLSTAGEIISERSRARTIATFGKPLAPREIVQRILAEVRQEGDAAVARYTHLLDGVALPPAKFRVTAEEIAAAWRAVPADLVKAMERAAENVRAFQQHIRSADPEPKECGNCLVQLRQVSLQRVGIYVPRGLAAYPSTLIMCAVPAQVAGVPEIAVVTPPDKDGTVAREVLAACQLLGITEVYRVGGVQGIGALAFGTPQIPAVAKIVGPGNLFVTLAKKQVFGEVGIDILAGPSEVLILADDSARPDWVAADMLSQAEHGPGCAVLLTPCEDLVTRTTHELDRQISGMATEAAARESLEAYGLAAITRDMDQAVDLANLFGPEHLEIVTANPEAVLERIRHAGAVFMGGHAPEAVGDYIAGPSHVLPTGGAARFASGLSVRDFLRSMSVISCSEQALAQVAPDIVRMAEAEGLCAHARSVLIRFETKRRR